MAGRVDHKGEDISLLADLVVDWDAAAAAGADAFARQVAAADRGGAAAGGRERRGPRGGHGTATRRVAAAGRAGRPSPSGPARRAGGRPR